jgi:hypothetical protein
MTGIGKVPPGGSSGVVGANTWIAKGLLNVGPGSNPPTTFPDSTGPAAGVWGYVGLWESAPIQTSAPPIACGVFGQGGIVGVNAYAGTIENSADVNGSGVVGFGNTHGVYGFGGSDAGVAGTSTSGPGVRGMATSGTGVQGTSTASYGVYGQSTTGVGVRGDTGDNGVAGVVGVGGKNAPAGRFQGNVEIDGDITSVTTISPGTINVGTINVQNDVLLAGGDCAEQFDMHEANIPEPGTIVVIHDDGMLCESRSPYDKRVAGVVSGAGEYRPALILDRQASTEGRASVALVGKVYCKVDADFAPISVGDLLTTSARPGHAMKAADPTRAFGAVIGKALRPIGAGQGEIPILIALQ